MEHDSDPEPIQAAVKKSDVQLAYSHTVGDWTTHFFNVRGVRSPLVQTHAATPAERLACKWCPEGLEDVPAAPKGPVSSGTRK